MCLKTAFTRANLGHVFKDGFYACELGIVFKKMVDPYYEPLSWFMIFVLLLEMWVLIHSMKTKYSPQ